MGAEGKGNEEYKDLYFEEKFKLVYAKLDMIIDAANKTTNKLEKIEDRVSDVERTEMICPITEVSTDLEYHIKQNEKDFKELKDITEDLKYYKKNPKQLKAVLIAAGILFLFNILILWQQLKELFKN